MCNLYTNKSTVAEMAELFRAKAPHGFNAPADVYPGYPGLVVREDAGEGFIEQMNWGFPVRLKGMKPTSKPKPINNARDEKLLAGFWKHWFVSPAQRCLIPFTAFAEAEGEKGKMTRTWISVADQPLAAWAGLGDHGIGLSGGSAPRYRIEIEHAVDDRGLAGHTIGQHVSYREGCFVEEAANLDRRRACLLHDLCCGGNDGV